jgi:carbon-monoxide dehydrogenase large subunit
VVYVLVQNFEVYNSSRTLYPRLMSMPTSTHRREDKRLITGAGTFVDDVKLPGALHVAFVRSAVACGKILSVETGRGRKALGIAAVFTGDEVATLGDLSVNKVLAQADVPPYPVLAHEYVMAVGQPVVAVLGETPHAALDASELITLEIEEHEPVLFDGGGSGSVAASQEWCNGDADQAFAIADHVVRADIQHPRLAPSPVEPRAIAANFDAAADMLTIWLSTQTPHRARSELARILGLDEAKLRVIAPDVGGAFGMKASLYPEDVLVAWAALSLRRAVRWTATRSEDFLSASHGRGAHSCGELALDRNGKFLGLRAKFACPLGHWLPNSGLIPAWNAARILPGPYDIAPVEISTMAMLTNTAPVGIYRGAGRPEAAMLMERLVDRAARCTGLDPIEIRKRNLVTEDQMPHSGATGTVLDSGDYVQAAGQLADSDDYRKLIETRLRLRAEGVAAGIGLAAFVEPCGKGWESARVQVLADGQILAATGSSTQGQGRETAYAKIVADVFGVGAETVTILCGDTQHCPAGIGALASRSTAIGGSAMVQAAREAKELADTGKPADVSIVYEAQGEAWGFGCYAAFVTVEPETGQLKVEDMLCMDDAGRIVDLALVEGQLTGGIAQGLGEATLENIVYNAYGQLVTGSLNDYALPRAADMPNIEFMSMETHSPFNLLGAKGVGEAGTIGAPAAILNATFDALAFVGVNGLSMPLTSEKIWRAIRAGNDGNA